MALSEDQLQTVTRELIAITDPSPFNFARADVRAAIAAVDQWCTDNAASFNTALPQPFRGAATQAQKAAILAYVALRRAGK